MAVQRKYSDWLTLSLFPMHVKRYTLAIMSGSIIEREREGPRRRPAAGGYARGDEKRQRIIEAAVSAFGTHGYERASTRQIAEEAGVNPPALQYYFESKQGLFCACAEHVATQSHAALLPAYEAAAKVAPTDREGATQALLTLLDTLADLLFGPSRMKGWSRFLARGQTEEAGINLLVLRQRLGDALHDNCARLTAIATGLDTDAPANRLRAMSIVGLVTLFHLSQVNMLAFRSFAGFDGGGLALLKDLARRHATAMLAAA